VHELLGKKQSLIQAVCPTPGPRTVMNDFHFSSPFSRTNSLHAGRVLRNKFTEMRDKQSQGNQQDKKFITGKMKVTQL
jgi:flagellar hook-basal body complex protein FliE